MRAWRKPGSFRRQVSSARRRGGLGLWRVGQGQGEGLFALSQQHLPRLHGDKGPALGLPAGMQGEGHPSTCSMAAGLWPPASTPTRRKPSSPGTPPAPPFRLALPSVATWPCTLEPPESGDLCLLRPAMGKSTGSSGAKAAPVCPSCPPCPSCAGGISGAGGLAMAAAAAAGSIGGSSGMPGGAKGRLSRCSTLRSKITRTGDSSPKAWPRARSSSGGRRVVSGVGRKPVPR